jgi:putative transcriptional regulator
MTITHHLDDATLMSFAAGALPAALAAVAAAHADMCPRCRREMLTMERLGEAVMASLIPAPLDSPEPATPAPGSDAGPGGDRNSSGPLGRLVGTDLGGVAWRWLGPGVWEHRLALKGAGKLRLLKVAPGHAIPEHGHRGAELTLVLRGSFSDRTGRYLRGDVADLDETVEHRPAVARTGGECICLIGSEASERFRGLLTRQWQRVRKF